VFRKKKVFILKSEGPVKGALNPKFLNLTINREKFLLYRNVLVPFLYLLLLKSVRGLYL